MAIFPGEPELFYWS